MQETLGKLKKECDSYASAVSETRFKLLGDEIILGMKSVPAEYSHLQTLSYEDLSPQFEADFELATYYPMTLDQATGKSISQFRKYIARLKKVKGVLNLGTEYRDLLDVLKGQFQNRSIEEIIALENSEIFSEINLKALRDSVNKTIIDATNIQFEINKLNYLRAQAGHAMAVATYELISQTGNTKTATKLVEQYSYGFNLYSTSLNQSLNDPFEVDVLMKEAKGDPELERKLSELQNQLKDKAKLEGELRELKEKKPPQQDQISEIEQRIKNLSVSIKEIQAFAKPTLETRKKDRTSALIQEAIKMKTEEINNPTLGGKILNIISLGFYKKSKRKSLNQYTEICEKFFGRKIQTSKKEQEGKGKTLMKDRERLRNYLKSVQKLKKNAKYKAIINDEQILEITKFHENTSKKAELNEGEMKSLLKYSEMLNGIITEAKKIDKQKTEIVAQPRTKAVLHK